MDFFKRHFEKIILAVALLSLIVSGILLAVKVGELSSAISENPRRTPKKGEGIPPTDLTAISNATQSLSQPLVWNKLENDPFFGQTNVLTNVVVKIDEGPTNVFPVAVARIVREPFKLLFKSYSFNDKAGEAYNFAFNFRDFRKTFFIAAVGDYIKDLWENTGYKITKFERKTVQVNNPQTGGLRDEDVSQLTLQHEGEEPLVLVLGRVAVQKEPVAWLTCREAAPIPMRRGQQMKCEDRTWIVVDITSTQVVIIDALSQERRVIDLTVAR